MTRLQEMKLIAEGSERNRLELQKQLDAMQANNVLLSEAHRVAQKQLGDLWKELDAQRLRADTAEAELAEKIRDEVNLKIIIGAAKNNQEELRESRDSFQRVGIQTMEKLAAAEQRIAELSANNQQLRKLLEQTLAALNPSAKLSKSIRAAVNPNPEEEIHE